MGEHPVFTDPSGRRWKRLRWGGAMLTVLGTAFGAAFVTSLLVVPLLPSLELAERRLTPGLITTVAPDRKATLSRLLLHRARLKLWRAIAAEERASRQRAQRGRAPSQQIVAAFYGGWQATGLQSLRSAADRLTHVMPAWLRLDPTGSGFLRTEWDPATVPATEALLSIAREHGVAVHPVLSNGADGDFDPGRVHRLLRSRGAQQRLATELRDWLTAQRLQGVNVDLENLRPDDAARLPAFLGLLHRTLHPAGLQVSVDLEVESPGLDLRALAAAADFVILMAYDEHYPGGEPGPIASAGWCYEILRKTLAVVPADKLVLGIGNYAYDWPTKGGPAEAIGHYAALMLARDARRELPAPQRIDFDADALNPTFSYQDEDGQPHEVWLLDAVTAFNQLTVAERMGLRGAALWLLGAEDPGIWKLLDHSRARSALPSATVLEDVANPSGVDLSGDGEVLSVEATPTRGHRTVEIDPQTGLCTDETWQTFPTPYVIRRQGRLPGTVALTFDDGPSEAYTPRLLDVLREAKVKATFFVVGENAERLPGLVARIWREGHEVGNHTFSHPNIAAISERRARLELNTTQRALQSILGRSTLLFRPPYNADAEPVSAEEVTPLRLASQLGYLTVGELIDPQDWRLWNTSPTGVQVPRTASELLDSVVSSVGNGAGSVVLLHDGGGDRNRTIELVRRLIPQLRAAGQRFVTVSQLLGKTRADVMPALRPQDQLLIGADRVVFEAAFLLETVLRMSFLLAITLGLLRVVIVVPLAILHRRRARRRRHEESYRPKVSVLVAAFNEQPVIVRTLQSILASDYPELEVIVVDDGSYDDTAGAIEQAFSGEPRVRLLRQTNTGKAGAVNRALAAASGEVQVCLDADTQIAPDCISLLVRHFANPRVAAVAGNIRVGNAKSMLTIWQSIEYITSQNLDREAYALLNAVSVVPGAVGAWRRSAVLAAGGYVGDTLAEDMDLTWQLRRRGFTIETEPAAVGWTEAPESLRDLFKQRFRWTHGTLQCLWKHRGAILHHGFFGWLTVPTLWLFQVVFQALGPIVDLQLLYVVVQFIRAWITRGIYQADWQPIGQAAANLRQVGLFYGIFFLTDLIGALIAFRLDRSRPWALWRLFWQRFVYRQLMYAVLWKSLLSALKGLRLGWGKLERRGTVDRGPEAGGQG